MKRKISLYILAGLLLFSFLFYLVFFFTFSENTITGELNRFFEKSGYELTVEEISKGLPLRINLVGITLTGGNGQERVTFPRATFQLKLTEILGKHPIKVALYDRENHTLHGHTSFGLNSLKIKGEDFQFSPAKRRSLPSFLAESLDLDVAKIEAGEGGTLFLKGKGAFQFDYLKLAGKYGMDVVITGLEGKVIFLDDSLYLKDCSATLLDSEFDFEGTISRYFIRSERSLDIEAKSRNLSPLVSNLLKLNPENEYNVKVRIRGKVDSPEIRVLKR